MFLPVSQPVLLVMAKITKNDDIIDMSLLFYDFIQIIQYQVT